MMRRFARQHETLAAQRLAGTDATLYAFAQPGDHVRTPDGPGIVADVYDGPVHGGESYLVVLDNGLGGGEYDSDQILEIIPDEFTVEARRYSQVPMACDVCGAPASKSRSGGRQGHTMLCPDCETERDRQKAASQVSSSRGPDAGEPQRGRDPHAGGDHRASADRRDGHVRADRDGAPGVQRPGLTSVAVTRYSVTISSKAKADYMSLTPVDRSRILAAVKLFQKTGQGDIKPLIGTRPLMYRIRVGKMRIVYLPSGGNHVEIIELGYRGQLGWNEASLKVSAGQFSLDAYAIWNDQIKGKLGPVGGRWVDRVCEMLRFSFLAGYNRSGDPVQKGLRVVRVAKDWPVSGSIIVEREDGARIRLYLEGTTFRTQIMNKGDLADKYASSGEVGMRTAARADLPLLAPEELRAQGLHTAADDYPQLGEILWERPDLVEAEPSEVMPRRLTLGAKTAARAEPVWLKERRSNPIKDSLNDKNQPWWWRKVVGPAVDRYNDSVTPDRQIQDYDDIHKIDSVPWCRFRRKGECYFPKEFDERGSEEAGYAVWIPYNRGECPWKSWDAQKHDCKVSEPGPRSGERVVYPDATIPWSQGGQRVSSLQETPVSITRKVESAWVDIREKAKRIRQSGGVRVIAVADNSVTGEIRGDTGLYTATVTTVPGSSQVALATCSCPWETYRWARSGPWKKLEGRACAHITALLYEMQARKMFGGEITEDVAAPEWRTEQPALENPKSRPGPWRLDVAASVQAHLAAITAQRDAMDARAAVEVHLDPQALSLGTAVANLADDESGEGALVSVARLLEARSLIDVPPFYAQVSGEIVVVDGFDEDGTPWANGRPLTRRQLMYPTFHPTRGITSSKKTAAHSGCMVALVPSPELAAALSIAAGTVEGIRPEPAEEVHLTLAYLGKADQIDKATFLAAVQGIAATADRLVGKASGWGTFDNGEEKVLWSSVDVPGLDVLRMMVVEGLTAAGLPVAMNHGFTPHMTAGYADESITVLPAESGAGTPLVFDSIVAAHAGEWTYFDLTDPAGEAIIGETKTAMFEPRPDGEVLAREGEIVYRRKSMLGDNGIEAWMADSKLVGQLIWERSGPNSGEIMGVDVLRNYRKRGIATKMFELAKQVNPEVHHSHALTEDGKAWSKAVGASWQDVEGPVKCVQGCGRWADGVYVDDAPGGFGSTYCATCVAEWTRKGWGTWTKLRDLKQPKTAASEYTHAGLVIKAADSGRVLMTQRTPYHADDEETSGAWEFPGGSIEEGETPWVAAVREFAEETGLLLPDDYRIEGELPNGSYVAFLVTVPHESWTVNAELLPMETMGIGWFDPDHVEDSPLTRPEVDETDWEMVKEASRGTHADAARSLVAQRDSLDYDDYEKRAVALYKRLGLPEIPASTPTGYWAGPLFTIRNISTRTSSGRDRVAYRVETADGQTVSTCFNFPEARRSYAVAVIESIASSKEASLDVEAEAEAVLHDEPQPALPEALGTIDTMDPDRFGVSAPELNSLSPRNEPDDPYEVSPDEAYDSAGIQNFGGVDPRVAWLLNEAPQGGDDDIAMAAQAALSKMALKTFSIEEQQELIHEGADDHRGARNTDRLSIAGTHYEYDSEPSGELDLELLW